MVGLIDALGVEIGSDLAKDVLLAGLGEIGFHDLARIGLSGVARDPHLAGGPQPEKPVPPCRRLELEFLVEREFPLEAFLAFLKSGHWPTPPCAPVRFGANRHKSLGNRAQRRTEG